MAEESVVNPERSRHCDPALGSQSDRPGKSGRLPELASVAFPRTPAQPGHAAGVDTRRKGVRCGRSRSPQSLVPKTWHSP